MIHVIHKWQTSHVENDDLRSKKRFILVTRCVKCGRVKDK